MSEIVLPPLQYDLHIPVLLDATLKLLDPQKNESYLDLTAGYGGHGRAFLERTGDYSHTTFVDRDDYALAQLAEFEKKGVQLVHADFVSAAKQLIEEGKTYSLILIDLGVSSPQLDQGERGFSFKNSGPLDMRMDRRQELTAEKLVNTAKADELARIIRDYGEESPAQAKRIAQAIVKGRPLHTTGELAALIAQEARGKWSKIHPATRTFQALRIALPVNIYQGDEFICVLL